MYVELGGINNSIKIKKIIVVDALTSTTSGRNRRFISASQFRLTCSLNLQLA